MSESKEVKEQYEKILEATISSAKAFSTMLKNAISLNNVIPLLFFTNGFEIKLLDTSEICMMHAVFDKSFIIYKNIVKDMAIFISEDVAKQLIALANDEPITLEVYAKEGDPMRIKVYSSSFETEQELVIGAAILKNPKVNLFNSFITTKKELNNVLKVGSKYDNLEISNVGGKVALTIINDNEHYTYYPKVESSEITDVSAKVKVDKGKLKQILKYMKPSERLTIKYGNYESPILVEAILPGTIFTDFYLAPIIEE